MFQNPDFSLDFGMDSPISLNSIDESPQFRTFSSNGTNKRLKNKVPVLKINLKALLDKEEIQVTTVKFSSIKRNENYSKGNRGKIKTSSIIRQAKNFKEPIRTPLRENNISKPVQLEASKVVKYKSLSPFQRIFSSAHGKS